MTVSVRPPEHASTDRVWRLLNRYYTVDVRVVARGAGAAPRALPACVGAHVLLLEEDEAGDEATARARLDEQAWLGGRQADVGVMACRAELVPCPAVPLCVRRMLGYVALRDAEEGVGAVRAALHAHLWPGMRRRQREPRETDSGSGSLGSSSDSLDAMERYMAALDALGPRGAEVLQMVGEERLAAAEQLVLAFAAALGPDVDL